jgi:hypothetical protein
MDLLPIDVRILRPIEMGFVAAAWRSTMACGFIRGTLLSETAAVSLKRAEHLPGHWRDLGE